jgi:glycine/D-amino acid oxidase-like deaminating enzyme
MQIGRLKIVGIEERAEKYTEPGGDAPSNASAEDHLFIMRIKARVSLNFPQFPQHHDPASWRGFHHTRLAR